MTFERNPWARQETHPPSRARTILWVAVVVAILIGISQLSNLFPNALSTDYDKARLVRLAIILVLVSGAIIFARRFKAREVLRNLAIWAGVAGVAMIGYMYRDELRPVGDRFRSELVPQYPVQSGARTAIISEDQSGAFSLIGQVNGARLTFLVDTGASDIVLSPADALRVGLNLSGLDYSSSFETAHGIGYGARAVVSTLTVGPVTFQDVPVTVNQSPMSSSLLGMSFLKRLDSFEVHGRQLVLRWPTAH